MNETFSAFYKIKLEILSNLLKEVTGLTLKANKNFLGQFTRGWGPNWTVNDGKALHNIFNFHWYSSVNPIDQFRIKNYRWIQTLMTHSYSVSLDLKWHIQKFRQASVWNLNIYNRQSNKQVFFSLEFVNIFTSDGG